MSTNDAREAMYLIRKGGAYYRPNAQGYTVNIAEAGRYTLAEAESYSHPNGPDGPRDGISYMPAPAPAAGEAVVTQADIDMANDYFTSAFRCTATLAERFARVRNAAAPQPPATGGALLSAAVGQNDAMRQELAAIGNKVSDLARLAGVDQANDDGTWPDLSGRLDKLIAALNPADAEGGKGLPSNCRSSEGGSDTPRIEA